MTPRILNCTRYGWIVQWADGAYLFSATEDEARSLKHPEAK